MKKLIPLLIIVMVVAGAYLCLKESGVIQEFDNAINERDGWHRIGFSRYAKFETVRRTFIMFSVLDDPGFDGIRVLSGAIKKDAIDRMEHVTRDLIETTDMDKKQMNDYLKSIARIHNCNTVIIDGEYASIYTEAKGFGI